jgi:hypothetical protein
MKDERCSPEHECVTKCEVNLAALRAAIDEGDASGIAKGDAFKRVRKALKLPVAPS